MFDIIVRNCGHGEWLPIIVVTDTGKELFRGNRYFDRKLAWAKATEAWDESTTGNIIEFKQEQGL